MRSSIRFLTSLIAIITLTEPVWSMNKEDPPNVRKKRKKPDSLRKVYSIGKRKSNQNNTFSDSPAEKENTPPNTTQTSISEIEQPQGDSLFRNGINLLQGIIIPQNFDKAKKFILQAAENGQNEAIIVARNINHPIPNDNEIIRESLGEGFFRLAYSYQMGTDVNIARDINKALLYYRIAAQQNNAQAQYNLALLLKLNGNHNDLEESFSWCSKAAHQNFAPAQYILGLCYTEGIRVPKNPIQALDWFYEAAKNGHQDARVIRGTNSLIRQDSDMAKKQLAEGFHRAGRHYEMGMESDFPQNLEKAQGFFKNSAQLGCISAQIKLYLFPENDAPIPYLPSIDNLNKIQLDDTSELAPIKTNEQLAQDFFDLGFKSEDQGKDPEDVIKFYLQAYQKGHLLAEIIVTSASQKPLFSYKECLAEGYFILGHELEKGIMLDQNFERAIIFYDKAQKLGHEQAQINFKKLDDHLFGDWFSEYPTPPKTTHKRNQSLPHLLLNPYIPSTPAKISTLVEPSQSPGIKLPENLIPDPQAKGMLSPQKTLLHHQKLREGYAQNSSKPKIAPIIIVQPSTTSPPPPIGKQTLVLTGRRIGGWVKVDNPDVSTQARSGSFHLP